MFAVASASAGARDAVQPSRTGSAWRPSLRPRRSYQFYFRVNTHL